MGSLAARGKSDVILPEILTYAGQKVLLVHGTEKGRNFWWPPGSYWLAEKACELGKEQPQNWVRRVLHAQVQLSPAEIQLRSVEFIDRRHPAVLVYEVSVSGAPQPSTAYGFDEAAYFAIGDLPENLGRDHEHGEWLKAVLHRTCPMLTE